MVRGFSYCPDETMFYVRQSKVIGPLIGIDGNAVATAVVTAIDQDAAHAISRISAKVIFWPNRPLPGRRHTSDVDENGAIIR
jgi:hypothetical protein